MPKRLIAAATASSLSLLGHRRQEGNPPRTDDDGGEVLRHDQRNIDRRGLAGPPALSWEATIYWDRLTALRLAVATREDDDEHGRGERGEERLQYKINLLRKTMSVSLSGLTRGAVG